MSHEVGVDPVDDTGIKVKHLKRIEGRAPDVIDF